MNAEGKFNELTTEVEKLMALLKEQKVTSKSLNVDTVRRYLLVARKTKSNEIRNLINTFEFKFKRNAIIDSISVLRALCGVAADDEQLAYLLKILFLEQSAGIRKAFKVTASSSSGDLMSLQNQIKGLLVRKNILLHTCACFPNLDVHKHTTYDAYHYFYGIQQTGATDPNWTKPDVCCSDGEEEGEDAESENKTVSSYASKKPAEKFMISLIGGAAKYY